MEPSLALTMVIAGVSAAMLALEAAQRRSARRVLIRRVRRLWPLRSVILAVVVSSLWASTRAPATASTPPAPLRLSEVTPSGVVGPTVTTTTTYEVEAGDCLWRIARRLLVDRDRPATGADIGRAWRTIYDVNRSVIGDDPDLIHPGQVFEIPEEL